MRLNRLESACMLVCKRFIGSIFAFDWIGCDISGCLHWQSRRASTHSHGEILPLRKQIGQLRRPLTLLVWTERHTVDRTIQTHDPQTGTQLSRILSKMLTRQTFDQITSYRVFGKRFDTTKPSCGQACVKSLSGED